MSRARAASAVLAGLRGAGSHRRQRQHLTSPPAVGSHPCSWRHPAKRSCKPAGRGCPRGFMQRVTEALLGAGWLPALLLPGPDSAGCCLLYARVKFPPEISSSYFSADMDNLAASVPDMGHRQPCAHVSVCPSSMFCLANRCSSSVQASFLPTSCHPFVLDKVYSTSETKQPETETSLLH